MESIKDKISFLGNYCKKKILGGYSDGYHLEEHQKQFFYFSKFSIDPKELFSIFQFVHRIQVKVFITLKEQLRKCVNELLTFEDTSLVEKDKMMVLFSACFLYYYKNFSYDTNNKFSDYFDVNFLKLCESYKFSIKSISKFQTFVYAFYKQIHTEIKILDYDKIKKLYKYYNPNIVKYDEMVEPPVENGNIEILQNKLLTLITCAKERIVDMVFEIKAKSNLDRRPGEINFINSSMNTINQITKNYLDEQNSNSNIFNNDSNMNIDNESSEEGQNCSIYSKRVMSELVKYEPDNVSLDHIKKISQIIDEKFLDKELNEKKTLHVVGSFVCYLVDFCSDFIKTIPGCENAPNDLTLEFIVPVKELYNLVMEIFFSISDLYFIDLNCFLDLALKKGIPMKFACCLYSFVKKLMKLMIKEGVNALEKMREIFDQVYDIEVSIWEKEINERGRDFTSICKL